MAGCFLTNIAEFKHPNECPWEAYTYSIGPQYVTDLEIVNFI